MNKKESKRIEISLEDLEYLEDIIYGCNLSFEVDVSKELEKKLNKFWDEIKNKVGTYNIGFSLPRIFKERLYYQED